MKPEFFCCIGGELKDTIQGIFKCSRVFIYRAAENQTIDDMLVDGFFNNADDIRVNDLIILYCPEESRAYTFAKVSSIIGGIVKTKELDTPNLPANISAFFNDVGYVTASNLATVAFTGNLSDLNDTTITNPATGEYLRWNGSKWINMAGGGGDSAVWGSIGGDIADQADLQSALSDKANVDMDNLTDTGANIANWSHNVTNCIIEIPQDIIIDFDSANRTATLKAGSKIYVPAGLDANNNPVYNQITISADLALNAGDVGWNNEPHITAVKSDGTVNVPYATEDVFSGNTAPTLSRINAIWYDTSANLIKTTSDYGSTWSTDTYSFSICLYKETGGSFDSLDEIFNGLGYVGSTIFALPGVKGLIPNGRNADGTLNNTVFTTTTVMTHTQSSSQDKASIYLSGSTLFPSDYRTYDEENNVILNSSGQKESICNVGSLTRESYSPYQITSFNPKEVFRAVDYSDIVDNINDEFPSKLTTVEWVKNKIMASVIGDLYPVGAIYIGTQSTCPLATLIPGSTWQLVATDRALWGGNGSNAGTTIAAGLPNITSALQAARRGADTTQSGSMWWGGNWAAKAGDSGGNVSWTDQLYFSAQSSSSIYGSSTTVQPPAYRVNVWRRTA